MKGGYILLINNLRNVRRSKGLLQKDVAPLLGISVRFYSNVETAKTERVYYAMLLKLSKIFDTPVTTLIVETS
jgi:transcriptional regulator with XRE-family HTH domain